MASVLASCKLQMLDNYGVVEGKEVTKTHTYSKIRTAAADSELYALATAINTLTAPTCDSVRAVRVSELASD